MWEFVINLLEVAILFLLFNTKLFIKSPIIRINTIFI